MSKKIGMLIVLWVVLVPSVFAQEWLTKLDEAKSKATETNQNILLVFSGSDWCVPCMKLEKSIWNSEEFKTFSDDHFVLLRADFLKQKKNRLSEEQQAHNEQLAEKYNPNGFFPLVLVLNNEGEVLGQTGYKNVSPSEYIKQLVELEN
ncbi:thioredoxin family protein [uncultured Sunxiuqinia sp.]|uniref:thioredoxin family protein n=1 Tax=uncultured Sunxiuqinia sp. TaxID=1573825 RepID=UPI0030DB8F57|tara:strand:- start:8424 stop:8867 length:444 start_codon:yes stop_codon:yes gene_type:complete